jgi:hypothetical protein
MKELPPSSLRRGFSLRPDPDSYLISERVSSLKALCAAVAAHMAVKPSRQR